MKVHTTNYTNTFIAVASDSQATHGEVPPLKKETKSVANQQFDLLYNNPYKYTSDELLFSVFAERNDLTQGELEEAKARFFSKGQPCLRCSPLSKRYGWGTHHDKNGKVALVGLGTERYKQLIEDASIATTQAMKSSK